MTKATQGFAICIDDSGYPSSLERHKVYRIVPDKNAEDEGDLRVIDESGEDYLYARGRFLLVRFPPQTARVLNRSFTRNGV